MLSVSKTMKIKLMEAFFGRQLTYGFGVQSRWTRFMSDTLHWLTVRQHILYRVSAIAWRCIPGIVPAYLSGLFVLSSSCLGSFRSASRGDYLIPRSYTATKQNSAFSVAGPFISGMAFLSNCAFSLVICPAHFIVY